MATARNSLRGCRGVTIVEFMIVLVVVGLLLAGILKGQELINNARTKKLVHNASSLHTAVRMFNDRYQALPGDFRQAMGNLNAAGALKSATPAAVFNGDGDGTIDHTDPTNTEAALAMHHLSAASMFVCQRCIGLRNEAVGIGNSPSNAYGGYMAVFSTSEVRDTLATPSLVRNIAYTGANLPVWIIYEMDQKLDDGQPHTGMFREANLADPLNLPDTPETCSLQPAGTTDWVWDIEEGYTNCAGAMIF